MKQKKKTRTHFHRKYRHNHKYSPYPTENLVHEALTLLQKQGKIKYFVHAVANDPLDAAHIDFLIGTRNKLISLQVKGCSKAVKKHKKLYPLIPVLMVEHFCGWKLIGVLARRVMLIFNTELVSHEHILDERTISIIKERLRREGIYECSPFHCAVPS